MSAVMDDNITDFKIDIELQLKMARNQDGVESENNPGNESSDDSSTDAGHSVGSRIPR